MRPLRSPWPIRDPGRRRRRHGNRGRDVELLRSASLRIGLQTGVLVLVAFCLCAGVVLLLVLRFQHAASNATLSTAVTRADDVIDPPNGAWLLVRQPGGHTDVSPGAPAVLPDSRSIRQLNTTTRSLMTDVHTTSGEYRVLTVRQPNGRIVQAALSLASEHAERKRLLEALAAAGGLAILASAVLGSVAARRSVAPLADALSRQRTFVADASHELRTPLTLLTTRTQLLARSLRRGDIAAAESESEQLVSDGQRLNSILEDLLSAAEPVEPSQWGLVDLKEVASHGVAAADAEAAQENVLLTLQQPASRPQRPVTVRAPRTTLDRAVLALLDNAIRHTPAEGRVEVAVATDHRWATLTVSDTGPGIAPSEAEHLLDRFAHGQLTHGTRRRFGLGLALVADAVQRLGGELKVVSAPGDGTAMTIRLPSTDRL